MKIDSSLKAFQDSTQSLWAPSRLLDFLGRKFTTLKGAVYIALKFKKFQGLAFENSVNDKVRIDNLIS